MQFPTANDRNQRVTILRKEFNGDEWIEMITPVCAIGQVDPRTALEHNASLIVGALAITGDTVILKFPLRLADLDPDEFKVPLDMLVQAGDMLEEKFTGQDVF